VRLISPLGTSATNWPIVPPTNDRWWMWSSRWNENWQGKLKYSEKTCPSATTSSRNPTWPDQVSNPGRLGGKPTTKPPEIWHGHKVCTKFEGESVNMPQMDIKRKNMWYSNLGKIFLDISSTNTDTFVPSLYPCVETRSIEVFWLLSQPLPHLRFNLVISETFATQLRTSLHEKHFLQETCLY
jgi:hypothetical protein